jgi:hypothetical protein
MRYDGGHYRALPISRGAPVVFWDVPGQQGNPVWATISEMGPLLFGRLLNLKKTQHGAPSVVFKAADEQSLPLLESERFAGHAPRRGRACQGVFQDLRQRVH